MSNKDIVDHNAVIISQGGRSMMFDREFYVEKVASDMEKFLTSAMIRSIMLDIIDLKQENRNIGDKIKSLYCNIGTNALKLIDCSETAGYTYNDRVMRDHTTIDYLEKLQMINSMLINKHRSKIRVLKKELNNVNHKNLTANHCRVFYGLRYLTLSLIL